MSPHEKLIAASTYVRCPRCGSSWVTSKGVDIVPCLNCKKSFRVKNNITAKEPNEDQETNEEGPTSA